MSGWNMKSLRQIAGVPLVEGWSGDDDSMDDEDPDVKIANSDKGQKAFETKNKKELKTASKEADAKSAKPAEKKSETPAKDKTEEKKPEAEKAPAKAEPAKEEKKVEASSEEKKKRGAAPKADSKSGKMREWYDANKHNNHVKNFRSQFLKHAETHGISKAVGSAMHARMNPKGGRSQEVKEGQTVYVLAHPAMPSYLLAENYELNRMQWVGSDSEFDAMVFETEAAAEKIAKYMAEWKGQQCLLQAVTFD